MCGEPAKKKKRCRVWPYVIVFCYPPPSKNARSDDDLSFTLYFYDSIKKRATKGEPATVDFFCLGVKVGGGRGVVFWSWWGRAKSEEICVVDDWLIVFRISEMILEKYDIFCLILNHFFTCMFFFFFLVFRCLVKNEKNEEKWRRKRVKGWVGGCRLAVVGKFIKRHTFCCFCLGWRSYIAITVLLRTMDFIHRTVII